MQRQLAIALPLLLVVAWQAWVALRMFPTWDDATTWIVADMYDSDGIATFLQDRPLMGNTWTLLHRAGVLWEFAFFLYVACWLATGIAAAALWFRVFPGLRDFAPVPGVLAVTPLFSKMQGVLLNPTFTCMVGPLLLYFSFLPLLGEKARPTAKHYMFVLVSLTAGMLISEYAVSALLSLLVIYLIGPAGRNSTIRTRIGFSAVLMFCAVLLYAVYHLMADPAARDIVRPEVMLAEGLAWRLKILIPRAVSDLYTAVIGRPLLAAGQLYLDSPETIAAAVGGVVLAIVMWFSIRRARDRTPLHNALQNGTLLVLALAVLLALVPVAFMGGSIPLPSRWNTRFMLPALPVVACLFVAIVMQLCAVRVRSVLIGIVVFIAGSISVKTGLSDLHEFATARNVSRSIHSAMPETGYVLAIFDFQYTPLAGHNQQAEWTARITYHWPKKDRLRFWAFTSLDQAIVHESTEGLAFDRSIDQLKVNQPRFGRVFSVDTVLWVYVSREGAISIERQDVADSRRSNLIR